MTEVKTVPPVCLEKGEADSQQEFSQAKWACGERSAGLPLILTASGCVIFGLALIANTQVGSEGGWFWYAVLYLSGKDLYSELHLALQPLAVLETAGWMSLAGNGWLVSKVPAVLHLLGFCCGIAVVAAETGWRSSQKAVLFAGTFFVGIHFEAYRFDDYHVMVDVCLLFSLALLLRLEREERAQSAIGIAAGLGILSGLAVTTRLNDGAALFCGSLLAAGYLAGTRRTAITATLCGSTAMTALTVVGLVGDSFKSYATYTVLHAAGSKGGVGHVLLSPLFLFWNTFLYVIAPGPAVGVGLLLALAASWGFLLAPFSRANLPLSSIKALIGVAVVGLILCALYPALITETGGITILVSAVWVVIGYAIAVFVLARMLLAIASSSWRTGANRRQALFLLPFGVLLSGSMSSGGYHFGLYAPVAFLMLATPLAFPAVFTQKWVKSSFLAIACLLAISGAYYRIVNPLSWHGFRSYPMFAERQLVHHPVYGPMIIDKTLDRFIRQVCSTIDAGGKGELLSVPFPYANYQCNIPPWQGFVQTFFDTSSDEVIRDMKAKLEHSPPKWVLYQRQLDNMALHEAVFNGGKPLPHRELDEFIVRKIVTGEWRVAMRAAYGEGNDWLLLQTD